MERGTELLLAGLGGVVAGVVATKVLGGTTRTAPAGQAAWWKQEKQLGVSLTAFPPTRPALKFANTGPQPADIFIGRGNPYTAWLASIGLSCAQWSSMTDSQRRTIVAISRFGLPWLAQTPIVEDFVRRVCANTWVL